MDAFWRAAPPTRSAPIRKSLRPISARRWNRMLVVRDLAASYGPAQVLFGMTFSVGAGEVVTLIGRNGMGKTTTIRTLMGLLLARGGEAMFEGRSLLGQPAYRIAQAGLGLVPEG